MPTIRKLQEDEVKSIATKGESQRAQVAREYDNYLAEFSPDEYGEAIVAEESGETKLTVKNRLNAAAKRRGLVLSYLRTPGPVIRFKVGTQAEALSTGFPEEDEQFEQAEQAEGPEPKRKRRAKASA